MLSYPDTLNNSASYLSLSPFLRLSARGRFEDQIQVFLTLMSISKLFELHNLNFKIPCGCCWSLFSGFIRKGLTFKSLIHFEFIVVCGVRRWSSFIFLHVAVQFSQHHSLNKLSLAHCMCLLPLSNINWLWRWGFISGLSILFYWSMCLFLW